MTTEIVLPAVGEPETLEVRHRELPAPAAGEAVVRVQATGVSFAEQQMRRGKYYDQPKFPFVPGYDLVGVVEQVGPAAPSTAGTSGAASDPTAAGAAGAAAVAPGDVVAALTKVGGWADRVVLDVRDLVRVPQGLDPVAAETVIVNGATAWRMLHRSAKVKRGDTIVVLGAAGGVGTVLTQLAVREGIRVIGTAGTSALDRVRELGAIALDYRNDDVPARVRELAPDGVAAVFDHVGGPGIVDSWKMLAKRGGTLVSYGTASTRDVPGNPRLPVLKLLGRLTAWNLLPNGRSATFFNLWAGKKLRPNRYRAQLREDLTAVLALVADGSITPQVAKQFPLTEAAAAMRYAEAGGITGKVVLLPEAA